nr:hypothetical protein [Liquorilactobacillus mali]
MRKPSLKRSISARTTGRAKRALKRSINPYYGKKGMGWINNPKKAMYNKVYHKTTFGVSDVVKPRRNSKAKQSVSKDSGTIWTIVLVIAGVSLVFAFWQVILGAVIMFAIGYYLLKNL